MVTNPTRADLEQLKQRIEKKISEIEGHTPGPCIVGKNPLADDTEWQVDAPSPESEGYVFFANTGNHEQSERDADLIAAAAHPDTGKLADLRIHLAHVEDHLRALEFIDHDSGSYFWARCEDCGWEGSSKYLHEDTPHAEDTNVFCPVCDSDDIEEANPGTYSKHTARIMGAYGGE